MGLVNYHTHSNFCDGSSEPEAYIKAALEQGFDAIGFSSHAPLPFENRWSIKPDMLDSYVQNIRYLKEKFKKKIEVFLSLEIDYVPNKSEGIEYFRKKCGLDYTIGGVHLVKSPDSNELWFIDGNPIGYDIGLKDIFRMDIQKAVGCYFTQVWEMISIEKPDIIAHVDKIKMNNRERYFSVDDNWYKEYIQKTIKIIAQSGLIAEVNTRGIYKKRCAEFYPSVEVLEEFCRLGVPVTVSSDAHDPSEIGLQIPEAMQTLREIGFREFMVFTPKGWKSRKL